MNEIEKVGKGNLVFRGLLLVKLGPSGKGKDNRALKFQNFPRENFDNFAA